MTQDPKPGKQGGVDITAVTANVEGDVVARDKIIQEALRPGVSALHQLPAPPADFTGRTTELAELLEAIQKNGVIISGLQGLGGVGKTALALKLAEQLKTRYPDAQFYIDLKGVTQPLAPKEAMARVIHAYHPTAQLPENEDEVRGLYLSVLHDKRALLLLDNARDDAQVRPLIPPQSCFLLVTSRQRFALPGLVSQTLGRMPHDDASILLRKIAPRLDKTNQAEVDKLAELCGSLPLALEKVASALLVREDLTPADYIRRLEDTRKRLKLTEIDAALQSSYDLLDPDMQQRFRFLAVFPESFDLKAAAAVWDTETEGAQDALGVLLNYSLVDFSTTSSRYRLHDLVRVFTGQLLSIEKQLTAELRYSGYYINVLKEAGDLYLQGGESVTKGLALFDTEWANIQAGQAWAAEHTTEHDAIADWCWGYPHVAADCLVLRQRPREFLRWMEQALVAARHLKQRNREGYALGNLGNAYRALGEQRRAIEYYEKSLQLERDLQDRVGEAASLGNLGSVYSELGEQRRAIEYIEQSLVIDREIGRRRAEGEDLGNLGIAYGRLGDYRRAIEYLEQCLQILRETGDRRGEGSALGNLIIAYQNLGEWRRALECQEQRLRIAREIGDREGEGITLWNIAGGFVQLGRLSEAIALVETALEIFETIESPHAQKTREWLSRARAVQASQGQ
jgi:tetratricopeptide (TPR) repeat protein